MKLHDAIAEKTQDAGLQIPVLGLRQYVLDLASLHQINYVKTYADEWAADVTRLADDQVQTDNIENLLIALKKAHRVSNSEMVQLLTNYLREKERV